MKALRIKLKQDTATYSYDNKTTNKNTLPLPAYSAVIGALHSACEYKNYEDMKISVQGKYSSANKKTYKKHTLMNRTFDDRGILVWLKNPEIINSSYIKVGETIASLGCSFSKNENIKIINLDLYKQFVSAQDNDENKKHFKTLIIGVDTITQLCEVELVIHIVASEKVLTDIKNNIYNLVSLGNSENYISLEEIKYVELTDTFDKLYKIQNEYGLYVNVDKINNGCLINKSQIGTIFDISKNYTVIKSKRMFNKIPCIYTTSVAIDENCSKKGLYLDKINETDYYIVNLN